MGLTGTKNEKGARKDFMNKLKFSVHPGINQILTKPRVDLTILKLSMSSSS